MRKVLESTGHQAIWDICRTLARDHARGPAARAELRKWLDEIEKPTKYSNQDIDRASQFSDFLFELATR